MLPFALSRVPISPSIEALTLRTPSSSFRSAASLSYSLWGFPGVRGVGVLGVLGVFGVLGRSGSGEAQMSVVDSSIGSDMAVDG